MSDTPKPPDPEVTIILREEGIGFSHNLQNLKMVMHVVFNGLLAVHECILKEGKEKEKNLIEIPSFIAPKDIKES